MKKGQFLEPNTEYVYYNHGEIDRFKTPPRDYVERCYDRNFEMKPSRPFFVRTSKKFPKSKRRTWKRNILEMVDEYSLGYFNHQFLYNCENEFEKIYDGNLNPYWHSRIQSALPQLAKADYIVKLQPITDYDGNIKFKSIKKKK
jgi:hypothetical protein